MKCLLLLNSVSHKVFSFVLLGALATGSNTQEEIMRSESQVRLSARKSELAVEKTEGPPEKLDTFEALEAQYASQSRESVFFNFDSFELTEMARRELSEIARSILNNSKTKIAIEGHADERGTEQYNEVLGMKRAEAVKRFLIARGVESDILSTRSHGEEKPVKEGSHPEAWAQNRRVELFEI